MDWTFTNDRPVWQQLTEQLTLRILKGEYPPGSRLPAVREVAAQAGVNPNTIQKAFRALEEAGVITSRAGAKSEVSLTPERAEAIRRRLLEEEAAALVGALRQMGLDREQAAALVLQLWDRQEESP